MTLFDSIWNYSTQFTKDFDYCVSLKRCYETPTLWLANVFVLVDKLRKKSKMTQFDSIWIDSTQYYKEL